MGGGPGGTRRGPGEGAAPWVAAACLVVTFTLGYAVKAVCLDGESGFWAMTRYCYSDVRVLWSFRGFDVDAVPYAGPPEGYPTDYTFEYPPGMALPAYAIGLAADSRRAFFDLHAVTFALAAAVGLWALDRAIRAANADPPLAPRSRWRTLGFALSPGLVLFGLQNWDLWPVGLVALGVAAAARHRPDQAAVWFGLGAATKWWPALLVVPLLAGPWAPGGRGAGSGGDAGSGGRWAVRFGGLAWRPAIVAAVAWAGVQVPALLISPRGWWEAVRFHLTRPANLDSAASAIARLGAAVAPDRFWGEPLTDLWTVVSLAALGAGAWYVVSRLRTGRLDPGDAALGVLALFLLTSKVVSPQFVLWLLPVAVIARVGWAPVLAVEATNAAVWLLYGPWMAHLDDPAYDGFLAAAQVAAVVRALALGWLVAAALWPGRAATRSAGGEQAQQQQAHAADGRHQP